jgi:uncharacterized protein YlxW (UPF0749 family)
VPDEPTSSTATAARLLPDQVTMGLLPYLIAHAVDEDYAVAAERRAAGSGAPARRRIGVAGALVLAVFAMLALTAAVQTSKDSVTQERERRALIDQVKARKAALDEDRRTAAQIQALNTRLESELLHNTTSSGGVSAELSVLTLRTGTAAVRGPGVVITADDAVDAQSDRNKVLDSDLQKLVNGLWEAGAEAISINGERLTNLSAIRHAGSAITVNFTSLERPYRILAIGNRKTMPARFEQSTSGQAWLDLTRQVGLRFTMLAQKSLRLPAADVPSLRYARPAAAPKGKGSS